MGGSSSVLVVCFCNQGCGSFLFLVFLINGVESSLKMCVICSCLTLSRNIHSASHSKLYIACFLFPKRKKKGEKKEVKMASISYLCHWQ